MILMQKTANIEILQAEINDFLGICIKIIGEPDAVKAAIEAGRKIADQIGGQPVANIINRPDPSAWPAIESQPEYNPLVQQSVVFVLNRAADLTSANRSVHHQTTFNSETKRVSGNENFALGFIETQGFTAVFEAIDSACKAANVEVIGKEKLGGGYVTVVVKGDVAAVNAAIEAGKAKVEGLGTLIASHVIARPSSSVLALLPKV